MSTANGLRSARWSNFRAGISVLAGLLLVGTPTLVWATKVRPETADPPKKAPPPLPALPWNGLGEGLNRSFAGADFKPGLLGSVAGCRTYNVADLLVNAAVRTHLKLTADQKESIAQINREADEAASKLRVRNRQIGPPNPEEQERHREAVLAVDPTQRRRLWAVLNAEQTTAARGILFQLNGELSFAYPETAGELNIADEQLERMTAISREAVAARKPAGAPLTEEQKAKLHAIGQEQLRRMQQRRDAGQDPVNREADMDLVQARSRVYPRKTYKEFQDSQKAAEQRAALINEKLRAVLTPEQRDRWSAMQGARIDAAVMDGIKQEFSNRFYTPPTSSG